jgi:hypothetical protein
VRDVVVAGELVVHDRRLTRIDGEQLDAQAVIQARLLWARLEEIPAHPFTPIPGLTVSSGGERWPT